MPKDEFDFEDPMELNGVMLRTGEDTTGIMAECFIEEFIRLGHSHEQILALFGNPHYTGMNMVLRNRGEEFVRNLIGEIFARWGRSIDWSGGPTGNSESRIANFEAGAGLPAPAAPEEFDTGALDPMGAPLPNLNQ